MSVIFAGYGESRISEIRCFIYYADAKACKKIVGCDGSLLDIYCLRLGIPHSKKKGGEMNNPKNDEMINTIR